MLRRGRYPWRLSIRADLLPLPFRRACGGVVYPTADVSVVKGRVRRKFAGEVKGVEISKEEKKV